MVPKQANLATHKLWSVQGLEIEYMIVDQHSLAVKPICDQVLQRLNQGKLTNELESDGLGISNELALHVIEVKTLEPWAQWINLAESMHQQVTKINTCLTEFDAILLPSAAHPFVDPLKEIRLWPHSNREIYSKYDHLFNCNGHGWGNLQSTHINLPFHDDQSFYRLHNAIRYVLPLIPALTASSPCLDGAFTDYLDNRLLYYGTNQKRFPEISGRIIPEFIHDQADYHKVILAKIYQRLADYDPAGILRYDWINSRGAIARFDRMAIEIRIMDSQEAPCMDVACAAAIVALVRYISEACEACYQQPLGEEILFQIYQDTIKKGMQTPIAHTDYLSHLFNGKAKAMTAGEVWQALLAGAQAYVPSELQPSLNVLLQKGNLAERLNSAHKQASRTTQNTLLTCYHALAECLASNKPYLP